MSFLDRLTLRAFDPTLFVRDKTFVNTTYNYLEGIRLTEFDNSTSKAFSRCKI